MKDFRITGEDPEPTPNNVRPITPQGAWIGDFHVTGFNATTGKVTYDAIRGETLTKVIELIKEVEQNLLHLEEAENE